ncbi:replication initiation protein [Sporosarcina sp. JAI121]|uniref:replication initiation protein n=1 Tax=Sporosarcina sp. JAI121 TaxID=2723064 RepID=UPI0015CB9728|nr:replication initiation protein [Sporosarcina sp. JAI121]NYF26466.1 plasmid replication initiation protein [Sporosarcina sp. JAI121]
MEDKYLVTQSNNLIEARHKKPLTAREQKIVLTMVSMIQPSDEDFKDYRISVKNFSEMLGLKGSVKYTQMKEIAENLMTKTIEIPKENGGWILANWISSAEYKEGEGVIDLSFSPKLKPYMLQLKNQFTSYRLSNILNLNSTYSIRLYELMKKWQHLGKWGCSIEDLRGKLGVGEGIYPRYANLKARVLATAIEEVNEKTDLYIGFNEIKKGRSVERIEFTIQFAPEKEIKLPETGNKLEQPKKAPENEDVRTRLNGLADKNLYQFTQNYFSQLYQGASFIWGEKAENELVMLIEYVNVEKSVQNPLGFIKSQIQLAWEAYERGEHTTFADLQLTKERTTGREEIIPDWFKKKDTSFELKEKEIDPELEEKRRQLQKELDEMAGK